MSFASLDFAAKRKRRKRNAFLAEMAAIVPWAKLEALSDPGAEKALYALFRGSPTVRYDV